jgi:enoyl-CoA hydratase/carnithine racemase
MSPIKTYVEDAILHVTLDRPKANAIDLATSKIMGETFAAFRDDPSLRVAIITGAGTNFSVPVGISRLPPTGMRWMAITGSAVLAACRSCVTSTSRSLLR